MPTTVKATLAHSQNGKRAVRLLVPLALLSALAVACGAESTGQGSEQEEVLGKSTEQLLVYYTEGPFSSITCNESTIKPSCNTICVGLYHAVYGYTYSCQWHQVEPTAYGTLYCRCAKSTVN